MESLAGAESSAAVYIARILSVHAERVRLLREEEAVYNARAELFDRLTEKLLRGEPLSPLPEAVFPSLLPEAQSAEKEGDKEEEETDGDGEEPLHVAGTPGDLRGVSCSQAPQDDEGHTATPSPMRRELEEFFPIIPTKRQRQPCTTEELCCRRGSGDVCGGAGAEQAVTATDILATIPCLSSTETERVAGDKPHGYTRCQRRRRQDYVADAALHHVAGEHADEGCTPSPYWEIAFPRTR